MSHPKRRATAGSFQPIQFTPKVFAASITGLFLAVLAFSQAAASTGIVIDTFRPMGGSFFSWRAGQTMLAVSLYKDRTKKFSPEKLVESGRTGLGYAPLSSRSLWMVGKGFEERGDLDRARKVMRRAEAVTRRDAVVQLWLAEDALVHRTAIAPALRHYDLIIRSEPKANADVLTRLAAIMVTPQSRRYLQPYVRDDNPWFPALLTNAANSLPRAEPVGRLLLERGTKAPNLPELEPVYAQLVSRLVSEGATDVAVRLYPMLPNGKRAALANVGGIVDGKPAVGYPPFVWAFGAENAGATPVSVASGKNGVEFYGASGTVGVAATKLVAPDGLAQLRWRVHERTANLQSSASWNATCVLGRSKGTTKASVNMLDKSLPLKKTISMQLPSDCDVVRIDLRIAGGIGTGPATLIVTDLGLVAASPAG
jgi:hypothetical protein